MASLLYCNVVGSLFSRLIKEEDINRYVSSDMHSNSLRMRLDENMDAEDDYNQKKQKIKIDFRFVLSIVYYYFTNDHLLNNEHCSYCLFDNHTEHIWPQNSFCMNTETETNSPTTCQYDIMHACKMLHEFRCAFCFGNSCEEKRQRKRMSSCRT